MKSQTVKGINIRGVSETQAESQTVLDSFTKWGLQRRATLGTVHNTKLQLTSHYVLDRMRLVRSLLGCSRTSRKSSIYATATVADSSVVTALLVNH